MDLPIVPVAARDAMLDWYRVHGRVLPFREASDPYAILVSEAMAQQTQAERAGDAWRRFLATFPSVEALASAAPADVVREWRGLGYNRRALNLWRAARTICERHGGKVPADVGALDALPGVGPYTARAVAAIAFGKPVGAVDTNVRRVLGRIVAGDGPPPRARELQVIADAAVPDGGAAEWTHAAMDVGATFCRPARPDCAACPARRWCAFAQAGGAGAEARRPTRGGAARRNAKPFPATSRWLRGQLVDRLRLAHRDDWTEIAAPVGVHGRDAVLAAMSALANEGLIEIKAGGSDDQAIIARLALS